MSIVQTVEDLVKPIVEEFGLVLWNVEFKKEGPDYFLRIFIDKDGGVNISDCEAVSRRLDPVLDKADPIEQSYILEVSSAGLVRELKKDFHLQKYLGHVVQMKLYQAFNGTKTVEGKLAAYDAENVFMEWDGETVAFSRSSISKITIDLV